MTAIETHSIDWSCGHCHVRARLPQIHCATIGDLRDAISRGHERRSFDCHMKYGVKHVAAVQDGKTLKFGGVSTTPPAPSTPAIDVEQIETTNKVIDLMEELKRSLGIIPPLSPPR